MALTLALPLFGLNPEHFSTLSMKLLNIEHEQILRSIAGSGRASPSAGSESSGVSSLATSGESALAELTPVSSRPETPIRVPNKSQEKELRILHENRNILEMGANVRGNYPYWQKKDDRPLENWPRDAEQSTIKCDYPEGDKPCGFHSPN